MSGEMSLDEALKIFFSDNNIDKTIDITEKTIQKKFRELSKTYHPDQQKDVTEMERKKAEEMFKKLPPAKNVLLKYCGKKVDNPNYKYNSNKNSLNRNDDIKSFLEAYLSDLITKSPNSKFYIELLLKLVKKYPQIDELHFAEILINIDSIMKQFDKLQKILIKYKNDNHYDNYKHIYNLFLEYLKWKIKKLIESTSISIIKDELQVILKDCSDKLKEGLTMIEEMSVKGLLDINEELLIKKAKGNNVAFLTLKYVRNYSISESICTMLCTSFPDIPKELLDSEFGGEDLLDEIAKTVNKTNNGHEDNPR